MNTLEPKSISKLFRISLLRNISLAALVLVVLILQMDPVSNQTDVYVTLLFGVIYIMMSIRYLQEQISLWKDLPKFRFLSWYYISLSVVWIVVLFFASIVFFTVFDNVILSMTSFIIFAVELVALIVIYKNSLHFIAIQPNQIMIAKKRIRIITPQDIVEVIYRSDILIFKLPDGRAIYINFLETDNAEQLRPQIADWLSKHQLPCDEIIKELRSKI